MKEQATLSLQSGQPMPKSKRFTDSIRPEVTLKKDAVCSLPLHFYGCLRQYVNALEFKARIDPERFIYATDNYFVGYCKRFTRKDGQGESYGLGMIKRCKRYVRESAVIGPQVQRVRKGKLRSGFILVTHDMVAKTDGNTCTLFPESHLCCHLTSHLCCHLPSHLSSHLSTDENVVPESPIESPIPPLQVIHNTDTSNDGAKIGLGKVNLDSAPNAASAVNLMPEIF